MEDLISSSSAANVCRLNHSLSHLLFVFPACRSLNTWLESILASYRELERTASTGLKTPSFGLGSFPDPAGLITLLKIKALADIGDDAVLFAEITSREKEHLREPPGDGVFLHGVMLHGCSWDNPPGEARLHPLYLTAGLPVVHLRYALPKTEVCPNS